MEDAYVKVMVVDDQAPFRSAARAVIGMTDGFGVVGEAASGEEAVALADSISPSLVLMDINMPGMSGIEATRRITSAHPEIIVVLLSTYNANNLPAAARSCGAATYVNKEDFGPVVLHGLWADHGKHA